NAPNLFAPRTASMTADPQGSYYCSDGWAPEIDNGGGWRQTNDPNDPNQRFYEADTFSYAFVLQYRHPDCSVSDRTQTDDALITQSLLSQQVLSPDDQPLLLQNE